MFKRKNKIEKISPVKNVSMPTAPTNATTIAVVLDGVVQEVLMAEGRLAALLLSSPEFIEVDQNMSRPKIGWEYDGEVFINPGQV